MLTNAHPLSFVWVGGSIFNRKEDGFKKREQGLKKKDLEPQESLIKFSKFLQETDAKRNRADKKAVDERRLRVLKQGT